MKKERIHELFPRATEAIVFEDGRIQRKLKNHEAVIGSNREDSFYIPTGAVNDNYGNLHYQDEKSQVHIKRLFVLRHIMYSVLAAVLIGFAWSLYLHLAPLTNLTSEDNPTSANFEKNLVHTEAQLERVADLIIRDGKWNKTRVRLFLKYWNNSDYGAKQQFKKQAWFQHFYYRLETKFKLERFAGAFSQAPKSGTVHPIMTLALALGVADPAVNYALPASDTAGEHIYQKLADEVSAELAKMEQDKLAAGNTDANELTNLTEIVASLKDPLTGRAVKHKQRTDNSKQARKPAAGSQHPAVARKRKDLPQVSITEDDIGRVLKKYTAAYTNGDAQELSSLFGVNDINEGKRIIDQLKSNYERVFNNSDRRAVDFGAINWESRKDTAVVSSAYKAELELKRHKGIQTVTANARMRLKKYNDNIKISSFELINRKANVIAPEIKLSSITGTLNSEKPEQPTAAELQDILTRLVGAYENGDINSFTGIFAKDAKTNDRNDLNGIRSDYEEIFNNSSDRQMFIHDMRWSYDKGRAKGNGDLEAMVFNDSDSQVYSMTGKIQIVAQRIDGKVLITHLYHLERSK